MAKKKANKKSQKQSKVSPEKYIKEKGRKLPLAGCYITPSWEESGIAYIIVSRRRPDGNYVVALYLVDTFCLGVKDTSYYVDMSEYELNDILKRVKDKVGSVSMVPYEEVHNIIYGAIEFAEEGGISPHKDFRITEYLLEEDTDDIPLICYNFGQNGKHCLVVNPDRYEMRYENILRDNLGDNFDVILSEDDDEEDYDDEDYGDEEDEDYGDDEDENRKRMFMNLIENFKKTQAEMDRHPVEVYSYKHPEYPASLSVKHQFLVSELYSPEYMNKLPKSLIDKIMALPPDEVAEDLSKMIMFEIGRTYMDIEEGDPEINNSLIIHALSILGSLKSRCALDAVLEVVRQSRKFYEYHLGDYGVEVVPGAIYACGQNDLEAIKQVIVEPGLDSFSRSYAVEALTMIAINQPERKQEIVDIFRWLLRSMVDRLPKQNGCDGLFAGLIMSNVIVLGDESLLPDIKAVFDTDCVDLTVCGDYKSVEKDFGRSNRYNRYKEPDVYNFYK